MHMHCKYTNRRLTPPTLPMSSSMQTATPPDNIFVTKIQQKYTCKCKYKYKCKYICIANTQTAASQLTLSISSSMQTTTPPNNVFVKQKQKYIYTCRVNKYTM